MNPENNIVEPETDAEYILAWSIFQTFTDDVPVSEIRQVISLSLQISRGEVGVPPKAEDDNANPFGV